MDLKKVYAVCFSPTGTTAKAVQAAAEGAGLPLENVYLTTQEIRKAYRHSFAKDELLIAGMPVYGGRLPARLDDFFSGLQGNGAPAIALVMYGNREYEDALIELKVKLEERGFKVIAGAAFIGQHTYSVNIAAGRPNEDDLTAAREFGKKSVEGVDRALQGTLTMKGNYPYIKPVLNPVERGTWALPGTTDDCSSCGNCVENCPWGAISLGDKAVTDPAKCLRCHRCIAVCPAEARVVVDPDWAEWVAAFEKRLAPFHKEPEMFFSE